MNKKLLLYFKIFFFANNFISANPFSREEIDAILKKNIQTSNKFDMKKEGLKLVKFSFANLVLFLLIKKIKR